MHQAPSLRYEGRIHRVSKKALNNIMEATIYNVEGKATGKIKLPEKVFGVPWNETLVHQVVVSMQANARTPVAHVKERGEIAGGGRKPWKQKGTGRARHGSIRSPLWRGGGVTFGPRNDKIYDKQINKKMRVKALHVVLSRKMRDGEVLFIDSLSFTEPKTSEAKKAVVGLSGIKGFGALGKRQRNEVLIAVPGNEKAIVKSFNNFGNIRVEEVRNLNPVKVLQYRHLVIVGPKESVKLLEQRTKKDSSDQPEKKQNDSSKDKELTAKS